MAKIKKTTKIEISDKLYIPLKSFLSLSKEVRNKIIKDFQKVIFDPNICPVHNSNMKCRRIEKFLEENPNGIKNSVCRKCPQSKIKLSCIKKKKIGNKKYVVLYIGDNFSIKKVIEELKKIFKVKIIDNRTIVSLKKKRVFKVNWDKLEEPRRTEQKKVATTWLKKKQGVCTLPPRSGKTILTAIIASDLKQKTLVLAHQKELLEQFQKDWLFATTLKTKRIKINPSMEEVEKLSVCLFTVQQFIGKHGKKRLKELRDKFGLVVVDEAHKAAAPAYSKVVNAFKARYRLGVTATYKRRDQRDFIVKHTLGKPSVEGGSEMLSCNFRVCNTKYIMPRYKDMTNRTWNFLWRNISKHKQRNEYIARLIMKDIEKGHKVIVPVRFVEHIKILANMVNTLLIQNDFRKVSVIQYSDSLIKGKGLREKVSQEIREGKHDVVIAISQMISLGFNAPPMSCIYLNVGGYMFDENNLYQQYSRVRTPCKGKIKPLIRIIQDDGGISENSTKVIKNELTDKKFTELKEVGKAKNKRGWK